MNVYLGIDSGGTKTNFILVDEQGMILAQNTQPASHYMQVGYAGLTAIMKQGMEACLHEAQLPCEEIKAVFASCAGYGDIIHDTPKIEEAIHHAFPNILCKIGNDMENAFAGSLGGHDGINVIAGTGSIGMGRDTQKTIRCGGWHHAFGGDEGSAYWIACKLIQAYTKQSDGREPKTKLYSYLNETYHFQDDSDILQLTIQDWEFDRTKVAQMAKDVYELALQDDPTAKQIYREAARELASIYLTIKNQLSLADPVTASYSGGVFKSRLYLLEPLKELLEPAGISLADPCLDPTGGSALLALELGGIAISETILNNLAKS